MLQWQVIWLFKKYISSHTDGMISRIKGFFLLTFCCLFRTRYNLLDDEQEKNAPYMFEISINLPLQAFPI